MYLVPKVLLCAFLVLLSGFSVPSTNQKFAHIPPHLKSLSPVDSLQPNFYPPIRG